MNVEYTARKYRITPTIRKEVETGLNKIRKILGYKPVVGFDEGLRMTWNYFVEDFFPKKHGKKA